ncbi:MAG: hypothetical protein U1E17_00655 [Geminicoccaceae bacterium]
MIAGRRGRPMRARPVLGRPAGRALRHGVLALVALTGLAACSSHKEEPVVPLCPRVAIINGLASLDHKDASGAVDYRAALEHIDGGCRPEGQDLVVDLTIDVVVQPARSYAGGTIEVPYFVAASAPNGDVLDRQDFVAKVTLAPGARVAGVTEGISQRFIGKAGGATDHQVLFGFVLPPAEALRQRNNAQ